MNTFQKEMAARLASLREQSLYRQLRVVESAQGPHIQVEGKTLLNFSSNDYLGLANEPALTAAACAAVERFGAGAGASRLICGSLTPYHELENALAEFKGTEAALSFSTGYAAALGTIGALVGKDDVVVIDKLVHASIVDAARLCGAKLRVMAHNDVADLEEILKWADARPGKSGSPRSKSRVLVITESVFSMDGDHAPLREIVELKERYGAWLMVDEAHATGLYGPNRRGLVEDLGLEERIEVQMGTLGKALGASGGYICGTRALIDYLVNQARSFIFSTAPVPAAAGAATAAVRLVMSPTGESRRAALWERVSELTSALWPALRGWKSAIVPLIVGAESKALEAAAAFRKADIFVPAIRYPTVARGSARLRVTLSAAHTSAEVAQFLSSLAKLGIAGSEIQSHA